IGNLVDCSARLFHKIITGPSSMKYSDYRKNVCVWESLNLRRVKVNFSVLKRTMKTEGIVSDDHSRQYTIERVPSKTSSMSELLVAEWTNKPLLYQTSNLPALKCSVENTAYPGVTCLFKLYKRESKCS
ncbi:hypothetical protein L9F63_012203, partial [Diploptera punctata]